MAVQVVLATFARRHTGSWPGVFELVDPTDQVTLRGPGDSVKLQLYIRLAGLSLGPHQLVVGPYDNPISILDFDTVPAHSGQHVSLVRGPFTLDFRVKPDSLRYPINVDQIVVGEARLAVAYL